MPQLMKGQKWRDRKHKMTWPARAEFKYDEIRCHVLYSDGKITFLSYAEKPLFNLQQFAPFFARLAGYTGHNEFDTGFEANNNFGDSYRWVRSSKNFPADLLGKPTRFMLFDLPQSRGSYMSRLNEIEQVVGYAETLNFNLQPVQAETVLNAEQAEAEYERARRLGFEGLMLKTFDHKYIRGGRPDTWQKMKPEEEADGVITGFHEAISDTDDPDKGLWVGKALGRIGSVDIRVADGSVASPHGLDHTLGRDMFLHPEKYLGQHAEFKYMERDRQGGYRHPTWHRLREAST